MIENEIKFVMDIEFASNVNQYFPPHNGIRIQQLYHESGARFRSSTIGDRDPTYTFNMKIDLECGRVEEFEYNITQDVFDRMSDLCISSLTKTRFVTHQKECHWDIDIFFHGDKPYFCMAEVEMPPEQERVDRIPKCVADYFVCEVSRTDKRFTSKKLTDVKYARDLFNEIKSQVS